jgi:hypothetical protein
MKAYAIYSKAHDKAGSIPPEFKSLVVADDIQVEKLKVKYHVEEYSVPVDVSEVDSLKAEVASLKAKVESLKTTPPVQ